MITFEEFEKFITDYQTFEKGIERFDKALMGNSYSSNIFESDWAIAVGRMLDYFIDSIFTECGSDLVYDFMFNSWDGIIYETPEKTLFDKKEPERREIKINTLKDLWDYMSKNSRIYFR